MDARWRITSDGPISDAHALECLMWMGRLTQPQLAQLTNLDERRVAAMLTRLATEGLVTNTRDGDWQPSGQGRAYLTQRTGENWNRYATIPARAPRRDLLTDVVIALVRQAIAAGVAGLTLFPLAGLDPQLRRTAPQLLGVQVILDRTRAGDVAIPWMRQNAQTRIAPGQQVFAFAVEALDATMRPSAALKPYARRFSGGTGALLLPVWVADLPTTQRAATQTLLQEPLAGVWAITDLAGLREDRVLLCQHGQLRATHLFLD